MRRRRLRGAVAVIHRPHRGLCAPMSALRDVQPDSVRTPLFPCRAPERRSMARRLPARPIQASSCASLPSSVSWRDRAGASGTNSWVLPMDHPPDHGCRRPPRVSHFSGRRLRRRNKPRKSPAAPRHACAARGRPTRDRPGAPVNRARRSRRASAASSARSASRHLRTPGRLPRRRMRAPVVRRANPSTWDRACARDWTAGVAPQRSIPIAGRLGQRACSRPAHGMSTSRQRRYSNCMPAIDACASGTCVNPSRS